VKLTIEKLKQVILEVLSEITNEESAEIQAQKALNFLKNSLKFSPKTKDKYITKKDVFKYKGRLMIFSELEGDLEKDQLQALYRKVNEDMKKLISEMSGSSAVEQISSLKSLTEKRDQADNISINLAKIILWKFAHEGSREAKPQRRDAKKDLWSKIKMLHNISLVCTTLVLAI